MSHDVTWLFVRHAESTANAGGWLAGHFDAPLSPLGERQALTVGESLRERTLHHAFCSDSRRAKQTCEAILAHHATPVTLHTGLRERHLGDWEGRPRIELMRDGLWSRLLTWDQGPPGGESQLQVAKRMLSTLIELEGPGVRLVVSHATALRSVIGLVDGIDVHSLGKWVIGNTEVLERRVPPGRFAQLLSGLNS